MLRNLFYPFQKLGHEGEYFLLISGCRESVGICAWCCLVWLWDCKYLWLLWNSLRPQVQLCRQGTSLERETSVVLSVSVVFSAISQQSMKWAKVTLHQSWWNLQNIFSYTSFISKVDTQGLMLEGLMDNLSLVLSEITCLELWVRTCQITSAWHGCFPKSPTDGKSCS